MAKAEASGTVSAFRHSKFKQDNYQTIVDLAKPEQAAELLGARVVWARNDGLKIRGRVVALHGSKGALRVRWDRGFPPQALGTRVTIIP
jgi:large subunit ribosomal protein L35Ae